MKLFLLDLRTMFKHSRTKNLQPLHLSFEIGILIRTVFFWATCVMRTTIDEALPWTVSIPIWTFEIDCIKWNNENSPRSRNIFWRRSHVSNGRTRLLQCRWAHSLSGVQHIRKGLSLLHELGYLLTPLRNVSWFPIFSLYLSRIR